ncbi:MAG: hypothetical protein ACJ8AW_01040 [Rhodopila sp.]
MLGRRKFADRVQDTRAIINGYDVNNKSRIPNFIKEMHKIVDKDNLGFYVPGDAKPAKEKQDKITEKQAKIVLDALIQSLDEEADSSTDAAAEQYKRRVVNAVMAKVLAPSSGDNDWRITYINRILSRHREDRPIKDARKWARLALIGAALALILSCVGAAADFPRAWKNWECWRGTETRIEICKPD